jgi:diadenosine tetraphosphate (Ap4A) HIT family hydrolase
MNSTIEKFGYPHSLVSEFEHWLVLLRPAQVTLGSLILAAKSEATAFADLPPQAFAELAQVTAAIDTALAKFVGCERLNYLMLMMVDPHVHFHVIPRYAGDRYWNGRQFPDAGWPAVPDLKTAGQLTDDEIRNLTNEVQTYF